jgi:hypothetical protein
MFHNNKLYYTTQRETKLKMSQLKSEHRGECNRHVYRGGRTSLRVPHGKLFPGPEGPLSKKEKALMQTPLDSEPDIDELEFVFGHKLKPTDPGVCEKLSPEEEAEIYFLFKTEPEPEKDVVCAKQSFPCKKRKLGDKNDDEVPLSPRKCTAKPPVGSHEITPQEFIKACEEIINDEENDEENDEDPLGFLVELEEGKGDTEDPLGFLVKQKQNGDKSACKVLDDLVCAWDYP